MKVTDLNDELNSEIPTSAKSVVRVGLSALILNFVYLIYSFLYKYTLFGEIIENSRLLNLLIDFPLSTFSLILPAVAISFPDTKEDRTYGLFAALLYVISMVL